MVKTKKFILVKHFDGLPKETDLKLVEEELPPIKDGEYLTEALYLTVDPYMRRRNADELPLGSEFTIGQQAAKVIESRYAKHPVGQIVVGNFGWRTHTIPKKHQKVVVISDYEGLPFSLALGVLGMPGNTAYFGFLEICQPKPGETVVVTGAGGAVGSLVGQIAKIKQCTVIGIAGSDEKGKWLVDELKFDHFINYKDPEFEKKLDGATPKGIDCFFDNVGGEITSLIISKMNPFGRISICGAISEYSDKEAAKVTPFTRLLVRKNLKMEGFYVDRWADRWSDGIEQNKKWIREGKLKYHETVTEGFENMPKAFCSLFKGVNVGKAIVKV